MLYCVVGLNHSSVETTIIIAIARKETQIVSTTEKEVESKGKGVSMSWAEHALLMFIVILLNKHFSTGSP